MPAESDYIAPKLRQAVTDRAHNRCEYCCCPADYSSDSFTIDHVIPKQAGGVNTSDNLAWACNGCNGRKGSRRVCIDPETQQEASLFHPRQQDWSENFAWNEDGTQMLGLTACGRGTIAALQLNRSGIMNLRRLLVMADLHPPSITENS